MPILLNPALIRGSHSGSFEEIQLSPLYFDRDDVKKAIHAPANVDWTECSNVNVFPRGDASLPSAFTVLPNVIEKSVRTVIVHGLADFILIAEGFDSRFSLKCPAY
jgi:carboxypeptidase D